ncbi:hypothetical protein TPE_1196 [Treponema pedis str. T A4]|uniref:Uncharacterized protein n=1 Tax=Treponema pedis str. T A4 TaxID=1291379 RepID=S6A3M0_9SPIR|nr:hypothetical protein TPE_1196 [Treponema pedis str. T A4]
MQFLASPLEIPKDNVLILILKFQVPIFDIFGLYKSFENFFFHIITLKLRKF